MESTSRSNAIMPADNFTSRLTSFEEITGRRADGPDVWLSWLGTAPESNTLPGIPKPYLREVLEGRALYVVGVPLEWQNDVLKNLFSHIGEVTNCPCIIDLRSRAVFRWIIMKTAAQATAAMRTVNSIKPGQHSMHFYRATPPGVSITFSEDFPLKAFRNWELLPPWLHTPPIDDPIVPAAPEPASNGNTAIFPATPQQPEVAVLVQPPTPPTAHAHSAPLPEASAVAVVVQPPTAPAIHARPTTSAQASGAAGVALPLVIPVLHFRPAPRAPRAQRQQQPQADSQESQQADRLDGFLPQAVTWANIVSARSSLEPEERQESRPAPRQASGSGPRLDSLGQKISVALQNKVVVESMAEKMRVVFLLNLPQNVTLTNVSDAVKEGSLHSIRFGIDEKEKTRYCGIVFQHANEAELFFKVINKERAEYKPSRFPFIAKVARGDAFPADKIIQAMGAPMQATRRLTVAKSRFFFLYNEARFRELCGKLVGAAQIQHIWLYNGGNATVIFANVESAIKVKSELERLAREAGRDENNAFSGLHVTFSKDPCVQELQFITDIHE